MLYEKQPTKAFPFLRAVLKLSSLPSFERSCHSTSPQSIQGKDMLIILGVLPVQSLIFPTDSVYDTTYLGSNLGI
jgi:hypothetical protein